MNGVGCGYFIHANTTRFRFERIKGVFNATDVNRDGLDDIVVYERQDWVDRCDTKTSWRRIYRLDASGGTLVDASKDFSSYYRDVEKNYRNEKSQYERTSELSKKECQQQYEAIIRRANALAGSGVSPVAAESKLSATLAIADRNPAAPVPGSLSVAPWRALELGKSGNGVAFRRVGNDAIAFFDKTEIAKCVKGSEFQGERKTFLAGTLAVSRVHVSPVSPTGAYIAVFCGDEDSASGVQLLIPQTKSFFSPLPRDLFFVLQPWISFSPDDRYAILNQSGDEGNYSPLVLNLITRQAKKLGAPLFAHDEKTQPVWLNDKIVKYRVGQICDDKRDASCKSMGIYEFEVDVSSMKVKRKRIADYRP